MWLAFATHLLQEKTRKIISFDFLIESLQKYTIICRTFIKLQKQFNFWHPIKVHFDSAINANRSNFENSISTEGLFELIRKITSNI